MERLIYCVVKKRISKNGKPRNKSIWKSLPYSPSRAKNSGIPDTSHIPWTNKRWGG